MSHSSSCSLGFCNAEQNSLCSLVVGDREAVCFFHYVAKQLPKIATLRMVCGCLVPSTAVSSKSTTPMICTALAEERIATSKATGNANSG